MANEEARKRHTFNKLTRLMISSHDFQQALSAATFLLEDVEEGAAKYSLADLRRFRCYETSMVIAYARPFSMAKGEVRPLTWKDTRLSRTAEETELHKKIIKHRNTLYGHSDAEFVEMRVLVMRHRASDRKDWEFDFTSPRFEEGMRFSLAEVLDIATMARRLLHGTIEETQRIGAPFKDRFTKYEIDISDTD
jgi:hypothetical protein